MCKRMRMIALTIGLSAVLCFGGCGQNENSESATKQESSTSAETSKKSSGTGKNTTKKKTTETSKKVSETKADSTKENKKTDIKSEAAKNETSKKVADNKNNSSNKNTGNSNNNNGNGTKPSGNSSSGGSSKPSTSSSNPAPSTNQGSGSGGGSTSGGNTTKPSTPQTSAPTPSKPAETQAPETEHKHNWVEQSHVVHHDATGHYEDVVVSEAWDEPIYETSYRVICNGCGADITDYIRDHMKSQALAGNDACSSYTTGVPVETVVGYTHHDAVTESKWVEDTAAYNETVVDGYKCSGCGATIQ